MEAANPHRKVHVTKAVDSTHQDTIGKMIQERAGTANKPWESRVVAHNPERPTASGN